MFIDAKRTEELDRIIVEEGLKPDETRAFVDTAFRRRRDPQHRHRHHPSPAAGLSFSSDGEHGEQKQRVLARLGAYFERFFGLGSG